jgi:cell division protein FtsI/penicillin-binding protein 2
VPPARQVPASQQAKPPTPQQVKGKVKLPGKARLGIAFVVVAGALGAGFTDGFNGAGSPETAVSTFLLQWQEAHYAQAARLTDGPRAQVTAQLAAAYTDLDASAEVFALKSVTEQGSTATATYTATVNLAEDGQQWSYTGMFHLTARGGSWYVDWAPSVINPELGPGDRLAVATNYAPRAPITDMNGQSLIAKTAAFAVGVYPGKLKDPDQTAQAFASVTGLNELQVLGQIEAAPPRSFLALLTLSPADFAAQWPKLAKVPGLSRTQQAQRLFSSPAQSVVGTVGAEDSPTLIDAGAAYQPGMTVGLAGYEQTFQDELLGTPTTTVEVVDSAGRVKHQWAVKGGQAGTPVQTTLSLQAQTAADSALAAQSHSADLVAVDTATGAVRALGSYTAGSVSLPPGGPLSAKLAPGMAFSIVSASALLSSGVSAKMALPCETIADVGGVTFTAQDTPAWPASFASDFASGCSTAFANMARSKLSAQQLAGAEKGFGIGANWQLAQGFSGSAPALSDEGSVAAQATGSGGVLVSPLGMAAMAAEVASGTGHSPTMLSTDHSTAWAAPVTSGALAELQQLMLQAVEKGSAHAAYLPGTPVYGQAGVVQTGARSYLSWFVGYRGTLAVAAVEAGSTPAQAAASLAGQFLKAATQ